MNGGLVLFITEKAVLFDQTLQEIIISALYLAKFIYGNSMGINSPNLREEFLIRHSLLERTVYQLDKILKACEISTSNLRTVAEYITTKSKNTINKIQTYRTEMLDKKSQSG